MIGNRSLKLIVMSLFDRRHYVALWNMWRLYPDFFQNLWRYLTARGEYPDDVAVRTPVGTVHVRLYSHHDLLTVNEIFCRQDYQVDDSVRHVIDIGANIGISALYFLTRNHVSSCVLYEPNPNNIERLKLNLKGREDRYRLVAAAVSDQAGNLEFGIEPTGRYGGIGLRTGESIVVPCVHINDVLRDALQDAAVVDILKIDTEGVEVQTVEAIEASLLPKVSRIYLEARPSGDLHPGVFRNEQYGSVRKLISKA